jgi:phenylacetate-CoA ligase
MTPQLNLSPKLIEQLQFVKRHSPYYQHLFSQCPISIEQIQHVHDFKRVPLTTKNDFATHHFDFYTINTESILEYCTTSGTTGSPLTVGLNQSDLDRLCNNEKFTFELAGVNKNDVVQLMLTLDKQFMAGLAYLSGLRAIGCAVVRSGPGSPAFQLESIIRHRVTVLVAVPSFLIKIIDYAKQNNIKLEELSVQKVICIGEPIRDENLSPNFLAQRISEAWNIELYSTYASSEMQTAFSECSKMCGVHLNEDLIYAEVLDDDGNEVSDGECGELVITHIGVSGMPLVRYQTGDIVSKYISTCECGLSSMRLGPVIGRKNQLLKINGTSVFPAAIITLLKKYELADIIIIATKNYLYQHDVSILLVGNSNLKQQIERDIKDRLKVKIELVFTDNESILKWRKPDNRKPEQIIFV